MDGLLSGLPWGVTVTKAPAGRTEALRKVVAACRPLLLCTPASWALVPPKARCSSASPDSTFDAGYMVPAAHPAETPQTGPTFCPLLTGLEVEARGQGVSGGRLRRGPPPSSRVLPEERR